MQLTVNVSERFGSELDRVCKAYGMNRSDVTRAVLQHFFSTWKKDENQFRLFQWKAEVEAAEQFGITEAAWEGEPGADLILSKFEKGEA